MLCGSQSSSSSELSLDPKVFPRNQLRLLLDIVCHSNFIMPDTKQIFLKTSNDAKVTTLASLLKPLLVKWESVKNEELPMARLGMIQEIARALDTSNLSVSAARAEEKEAPIDQFAWAVLCKSAIQNGEILVDSHEINVAKWILLEQLKSLYQRYKTTGLFQGSIKDEPIAVFNKSPVRRYMREFLGQLSISGEATSAEILHDFLYLASQVWASQKSTLKKKVNLAMAFAPPLFEGMKIFQELFKESLSESPSREEQQVKSIELYNFFQLITACLIGDKLYRHPFDQRLYLDLKQPSYHEELQKAQARLTPRRRHSLQSLFQNLSLSSPPKEDHEEKKRRAINTTPRSTPSSPGRVGSVDPKSPRTPRVAQAPQSGPAGVSLPLESPAVIAASLYNASSSSGAPVSPTQRYSKKGVSFCDTSFPVEPSTSAPTLLPAFSLANRSSGDTTDEKEKPLKLKHKSGQVTPRGSN